MNGTINYSLATNQVHNLSASVDKFIEAAESLKENLLLLLPAKENSYLKLMQDTILASREVSRGDYDEYNNVEDLIADLHRAAKKHHENSQIKTL